MLEASTPHRAAGARQPQENLERVTRAALRLCDAPVALLFLASAGGWRCASAQGLDAIDADACAAFCVHAQHDDIPFIVDDAAADPRFSSLDVVAGTAQLRFFAGWPLCDDTGRRTGMLAILDRGPRTPGKDCLDALRDLVHWAEAEIDRSAARQTLAATTESEVRLHAVLDTVGEGIITLDQYGLITSINRAAVRIFGYQPEELLGKTINMLMPQRFHHEHDGHLQNFRDTGRTRVIGLDREVTGQRKDGTQFAMAITVNEMWIDGRRGFAGIMRDITEQRANERKLRETNTLLQAVMSSASAFVYVRDLAGRFLFVNKEYERVFGVAADDVIGKTPDDIFSPEMAEHIRTQDREVLEGGVGTRVEDELPLKDGSHTFLVVRKPLTSEKGKIYGVCGVGTDITLRKQAEHFKNEFISTVSHELRTPLTSIRGSLGLLGGGVAGELPERAKSLLEIASTNCERLVRLINDILDIEKIESGHMRFELLTQRLQPLAEQALAATRDYAAQYGVALEMQRDDNARDAADALVAVDGDRIVQVIVNLLSNAAKFSPPGASVKLRLSQMPGRVRLSVLDRGQGIPHEFRSRVFQKFAQADSSDTRQKGGTGLGLSISRAIIERHRGRIDFNSTPGAGSEFYFDLPLVPAPARAMQAGRVLVCEDDPDIARLLGLMLTQAGMETDVAHDAAQARRLLAERVYDGMTLDLSLPQEDGISLLRWMRAQDATRFLPVVVVSARAEQGQRELTGGAFGIIDWIPKPVDQARLLAALQSAMHSCKDGALPVLHVEDDPDLARVMAALLAPSFTVSHAATLAEARAKLATECYSLILLDLNLPDGHGSELLGALPARNAATPVVVFSAQEADRATIAGVQAALVKSRTCNEQLLAILQELIRLSPLKDDAS